MLHCRHYVNYDGFVYLSNESDLPCVSQSQFSRPRFLCPQQENEVDWTLCSDPNPHLSSRSQRKGISLLYAANPLSSKRAQIEYDNSVFWCFSGSHWEDRSEGGFCGRRQQTVHFWGKFTNLSFWQCQVHISLTSPSSLSSNSLCLFWYVTITFSWFIPLKRIKSSLGLHFYFLLNFLFESWVENSVIDFGKTCGFWCYSHSLRNSLPENEYSPINFSPSCHPQGIWFTFFKV